MYACVDARRQSSYLFSSRVAPRFTSPCFLLASLPRASVCFSCMEGVVYSVQCGVVLCVCVSRGGLGSGENKTLSLQLRGRAATREDRENSQVKQKCGTRGDAVAHCAFELAQHSRFLPSAWELLPRGAPHLRTPSTLRRCALRSALAVAPHEEKTLRAKNKLEGCVCSSTHTVTCVQVAHAQM